MTLIQKALWLCRGYLGSIPTCRYPSWCEVRAEGGFRVCAPRLPPNKSTINEKQKTPLSPSSLRLCSTARPGGDTSFRERREKWRGGIIGRREGKKTATEVTWTKRGFTARCDVKWRVQTWCRSSHFSPRSVYFFFSSSVFHQSVVTVPQRRSFRNNTMKDAHKVCIESKTRGLGFVFWLQRLRRKTAQVFKSS